MSSTNEAHLQVPPPKPRLSPLEFRNTDLVSRLLAATPPYLYNMSLLPNTYFFSEMLRSFVQAKSPDHGTRPIPGNNIPAPNRRSRKRPWSSSTRNETLTKSPDPPPPQSSLVPSILSKSEENDWMLKSSYIKPNEPLELTMNSNKLEFENDKKLIDPQIYSHQDNSSLILAPPPPPPPLWYPPLYPGNPYGIDPLHFFIDLRVSSQIYDKKKEEAEANKNDEIIQKDIFKQSRHRSAFSVPIPNKNKPLNLTNDNDETTNDVKKFDVKSLGIDKSYTNNIGTNYIMSNIYNIYKNAVNNSRKKDIGDGETDEEKEKKVKDLRALIGLELVVDYMNHAKPQAKKLDGQFSAPLEGANSPHLEVVAVHDET